MNDGLVFSAERLLLWTNLEANIIALFEIIFSF